MVESRLWCLVVFCDYFYDFVDIFVYFLFLCGLLVSLQGFQLRCFLFFLSMFYFHLHCDVFLKLLGFCCVSEHFGSPGAVEKKAHSVIYSECCIFHVNILNNNNTFLCSPH